MAKTWTATDLELGKLSIVQVGTVLYLERRYVFTDAAGEILAQIVGGSVLEEMEISSIPSAVLSALVTIDTWTKSKALEQEGM